MFGQNIQLLSVGIGGLGDFDFGPGIASYKSWIVGFAILLALTWLARWTLRPARRAARTKQRHGVRETDLPKPAAEHGGVARSLATNARKA